MKIVLKRILVPTDFTNVSRTAVAYGAALSEEFGASLHLLHVLDGAIGIEPLTLPLGARKVIERKAEATAWEELRTLLSKEDQARVRAVLALEWGTPFVEIVRYARTHAIDLIAMSGRTNGHATHVLLGSVVENVLHSAPCPVLTLRPREREFVQP